MEVKESIVADGRSGEHVDQWFSTYVTDSLGQFKLPAGKHRIEFAPVGRPEGELMRFRALHLGPAD